MKVTVSNDLSDVLLLKVKGYTKRVAAIYLTKPTITLGIDVYYKLDANGLLEAPCMSDFWVIESNNKIQVYLVKESEHPMIEFDYRIASYIFDNNEAKLVFTKCYKVM